MPPSSGAPDGLRREPPTKLPRDPSESKFGTTKLPRDPSESKFGTALTGTAPLGGAGGGGGAILTGAELREALKAAVRKQLSGATGAPPWQAETIVVQRPKMPKRTDCGPPVTRKLKNSQSAPAVGSSGGGSSGGGSGRAGGSPAGAVAGTIMGAVAGAVREAGTPPCGSPADGGASGSSAAAADAPMSPGQAARQRAAQRARQRAAAMAKAAADAAAAPANAGPGARTAQCMHHPVQANAGPDANAAPAIVTGAMEAPPPPPPKELDQLHALGDAKFGKHNKFKPSTTGALPKGPSPQLLPTATAPPIHLPPSSSSDPSEGLAARRRAAEAPTADGTSGVNVNGTSGGASRPGRPRPPSAAAAKAFQNGPAAPKKSSTHGATAPATQAAAEAAASEPKPETAPSWAPPPPAVAAALSAAPKAAPTTVVARVGPAGMGIVLDEANRVVELVTGGQAASDGLLMIGDVLLTVDGEPLRRRPLARVLPPGRAQYTFTLRRDTRTAPGAPSWASAAESAVAGTTAAVLAPADSPAAQAGAAASGHPGRKRLPAGRRDPAATKAAPGAEVGSVGGVGGDGAGGGSSGGARGGSSGGAGGGSSGGGGGGTPYSAGGSKLETWLMQKAMEVVMVFRKPVGSARALSERIEQCARLQTFMQEMQEMGQELSMELDIVFQSLLQGVAEANGMLISGKAGFDSQAGQFKAFGAADFVPMHQAKVLDRSDRLKEDEARLRTLTGERWPWLIESADLLRNLLRVKVEDGNDLQMAATTVRELDRFYVRLVECATQSGEDRYDLYQRLVSF